ncbi:MAG TPA: phosphate acyltransferase [Clostridia bacterium]|nr:phosphate acyltransferase [Clostridia bacterium]
MVLENFDAVLKYAKTAARTRRVAVAGAADGHVIEAVLQAKSLGIAEPVLIGDLDEIGALLAVHDVAIEDFSVIAARSPNQCGEAAVELIKAGAADFIMKGMIETRDVLKPLVKKENRLNTGRTMSHVGFFEVPRAKKLMIITDGGMLIAPTLEEKRDIVNNAVSLLCDIGYKNPSVAVLCAIETVNAKMVETTDAQALVEMNRAGEIPNCTVVGPISYDLVMSSEIAQIKHYDCPYCGDFDILVAPTMACGNILAKSWILTAGADMAGLIVGAKVPVVLNSRGSSATEKLYSLALAALSSSE